MCKMNGNRSEPQPGKLHLQLNDIQNPHNPSIHWIDGPIVVGAGPAGLATSVCLKLRGIPYLLFEKEDCIASLWRYRTYNRLRLHLPKHFCELPHMSFPPSVPNFPTRDQFLQYIDEYAASFNIKPLFKESVKEASYCPVTRLWQVECQGPRGINTYVARWLVVATGENAQPVWPNVPGLASFKGSVCHSSEYKSGEYLRGKRVLVVGSGNSGFEVALDLVNHHAQVFLSIRDRVHVLPKQMLGFSTFSVAMTLLKLFSLHWTDRLLLMMSRLILGDTRRLGFERPEDGPMLLKFKTGRTPSLDAGTISKIREGSIKIVPEVKEFSSTGCSFKDDTQQSLDAVILATGFKSNVPYWLRDNELFTAIGMPNTKLACTWKGKNGLYSAGFGMKGLLGISEDAAMIAEDISKAYMSATLLMK